MVYLLDIFKTSFVELLPNRDIAHDTGIIVALRRNEVSSKGVVTEAPVEGPTCGHQIPHAEVESTLGACLVSPDTWIINEY